MTRIWIFLAGMLLVLSGAAHAAAGGPPASLPIPFSATGAGLDQPEEQQLQATRLLNMLASMVRDRSPFLARVLVFFGLILKALTNRTILRILLMLLIAGIAASAALVAWAAIKRKKAEKPGPAPIRHPLPSLPLPPQMD